MKLTGCPGDVRQKRKATMGIWSRYKPTKDAPWDLRRVVHLHRRAGFAARWDELQRDLADGPGVAIGRLLQPQPSKSFETMARTIGDAAMASGSPGRLKAWWCYRMLMSPDPLGERLTMMWHNHFATSNRKVQDLVKMREQNELFRRHARASFLKLLDAAIKSPAMLVWLDVDSNRKGKPNENLSRELLELFTLGIGNYSETDVQEAARALTGWTLVKGRFGFREVRHDDGMKELLGTRAAINGDQLLERLAAHPATAMRIAWRICHTFMGEGAVSDDATEELAAGLIAHGLDVGWGVETVLRSSRFFSESNIRCRITGPLEYIIGTIRSLELRDPPPSTLVLAEWAARMGQDLFYPPNVGGWTEGRSWLGARSTVARTNFAAALTSGRLWNPAREPRFDALFDRHDIGNDQSDRIEFLTKLWWGRASAPDGSIAAAAESDRKWDFVSQLLAQPENILG